MSSSNHKHDNQPENEEDNENLFQDLEQVYLDSYIEPKETNLNTDSDKEFTTQQAKQAHSFRDRLFWVLIAILVVAAGLWGFLIIMNPTGPKESFYLWGFKSSLSTVAVLTLAVSLLRFSLRISAGKDSKDEDEIDYTKIPSKLIKRLLSDND